MLTDTLTFQNHFEKFLYDIVNPTFLSYQSKMVYKQQKINQDSN